MLRVLGALASLALASVAVFAQVPTTADSTYRALLARLKARDTTVDVTALRMAYAASSAYSPYGSSADNQRERMAAAFAQKDYRRVILEADSVLAVNYLEARPHLLRAYASQQLGDSADVKWDRLVAHLLFLSVTKSGNASPESPWIVISTMEEYTVLNMMGLQSTGQSLVSCRAHPCDKMDAESQNTGEQATYYFDVSIPMAWIDNARKPR